MKRIRNSRAARILSWVLTVTMIAPIFFGLVAPTPAYAGQTVGAGGGSVMTVIVTDFVNNSRPNIGGDALARFATDAVAVEMASSGRYEVLKREEVIRTANDLGYRAPYDNAQLVRIASTLGATAIVKGEVASVRSETRKGADKAVTATLRITILDTSSGEPINGAAQMGVAVAKPGLSDTESLAQEAVSKSAVLSVKQIISFTLPEGIITSTVGNVGSLQILINRGSRDGVKPGMEMLVVRDRVKVGKIRVTNVFPTDSEAAEVENLLGLRPTDTIRAIFPVPVVSAETGIPRSNGAVRRSSSMAAIGKVLLVVALGAIIATSLKGGNSTVTGVTAEADIENGSPVVRLNWRSNLFGGQTLEYHVWRTQDNPFNFSGTPTAAVQAATSYTDRPAPFAFFDGVRSFLQPPLQGGNNGGGNGGAGNATSVTPAAGSGLGFTPGRTYTYQITGVVRRTASNQNNNGGGGNGGGNTQTTEDIESDPVSSGPTTPIFQPRLDRPRDLSQNQDLRAVQIQFPSVQGADEFQVELSTDRTFKNRKLIVQLGPFPSTAPNTSGVPQPAGPLSVDLTNNAILKLDPTFANFVNRVPNASRPTIYIRVGARNSGDRPGPVHWITRNNHDEDRSFRFIYSDPNSFTPADMPPNPP